MAATDRFSLHLVDAHEATDAVALLRSLFAKLCEAGPVVVLHPVADDAALSSERALATNIDRRIGQCLTRLRAKAPFGELTWRDARVSLGGREAAVTLDTLDGNTVIVSFAIKGASVTGGYRLGSPVAAPTPSLVDSVRSVMDALRAQ